MQERIIYRYSDSFKRQVVEDLERGRFRSAEQARVHYGIGGMSTIPHWLGRYGKNHLQAKVVRVEKLDEAEQLRQLKSQIAQLQKALGQTQAENVLNREFLKLACERLGEEVESFKKKSGGKQCGGPESAGR